jgi:RNA polymerase sigma-70 factor (ECF subfamily)
MFGPGSSKYKSFDDAALLHQFRKTGNLEVLGALYHRYMHLVYGVGLKYYKNTEESKDAVMQIFEKLIESVPKQEIQNFKSWLFVVTKNHCLMTLRKNKIEEDSQSLFMESDLVQHLNGEENEGYQASLNNALLNLPEHQRRCVQLFYYQSMSYQEISEATGYELKKVKSYIQNGKRKLKLYLAK